MFFLLIPDTDPYINLATEEILLKNTRDDFLLLWRNAPSVIIGKHQNTLKEVNMDVAEAHKLEVVRRISGGGTVYHDTGNLNFSFIMNGEKGKLVDFRKYITPIQTALLQLGLDVTIDKRNNLFINDLKISGNAEHVYKNRVLHHGTLLFNANLERLMEAITIKPLSISDKAIQSVRKPVTNIATHLSKKMDITAFTQSMSEALIRNLQPDTDYSLEPFKETIAELAERKYKSWDWNYGYSPQYILRKSENYNNRTIHSEVKVRNGIMESIVLEGTEDKDLIQLGERLTGQRHSKKAIADIIKNQSLVNLFI